MTARMTNDVVRNRPMAPLRWRSRRANALLRLRVRGTAPAGTGAAALPPEGATGTSAIADPRVDGGVEHVDDQVDEHELDGEHQQQPLDHGVVAGVDRLDQQPAETVEVEHRLDDDGAGQQEPELQPDDGEHGDERV